MKVDGLGVILAIILLPIILIVTYYIQMQVDTIATENQYNTKLLDATYDAMSAFEINTANEKLSTVADSMRSIVLASNNILINSLATNFGISNASKERLQPYIPAVLYTMYDGYYIYSPTEKPRVAMKNDPMKDSEGNEEAELTSTSGYYSVGDEPTGVEINDNNAVYGDVLYEIDNNKDGKPESYTIDPEKATKDTNYILKSYVQYSARYNYPDTLSPTIDVTINYTLDNYLNIVGNVNGVYYTKTGYLIKKDLVGVINIDGVTYDYKTMNEDDIRDKILGKKTNAEETTIPAASSVTITVNGEDIIASFPTIDGVKTVSELEEWLEKNPNNENYNDVVYAVQQYKACAYYASSACFSNWVYDNLENLQCNNIVDSAVTGYYQSKDDDGNIVNKYNSTSGAGVDDLYYKFENDSDSIFEDTEHPDPEDSQSHFNTHKMEVIKNSIKYNLNLAMSTYNKMDKKLNDYEASMPVLLDEEWDKILNNISIVSFMQGWDCGLKIYNNYQIVSSTNNELAVTPSEIYYVKKYEFNKQTGNYHRIDCEYLERNTEYISFKSKEAKYDKVYDKNSNQNQYDHRNLACYTCINSNNYKTLFQQDDKWYNDNNKKYSSYYDRISSLENENKRKAGYVGIANARQSTYKTNALPVSEGYQLVKEDEQSSNNNKVSILSLGLPENKIKELQITFANTSSGTLESGTLKEPILGLKITVKKDDSHKSEFDNISISLDQKKEQTITLDVSNITHNIDSIEINKTSPSYNVTYKVESIKAIYK